MTILKIRAVYFGPSLLIRVDPRNPRLAFLIRVDPRYRGCLY